MASKSDKNLMTVNNLGVCFGPTLLRPEEETVASIMDLKFYNVVVDILIENYQEIFHNEPGNVLPDTSSPKNIGFVNIKSYNEPIISKKQSEFFKLNDHSNSITANLNEPVDQYIKQNNHIATVKPLVYNQPMTCVSEISTITL